MNVDTPGVLVTTDGTVFRGRAVGVEGIAIGEVVFNTSMTGYQEVFTDPSYAGQIVVMTTSHVGNYGTTPEDDQSVSPAASGVVLRALATRHSNWRARGSLGEFLARHGLVGLADVDTRRLTRHIRDRGAMPAAIGSGVSESEVRDAAERAPSMNGLALAPKVSTRDVVSYDMEGARGHVVAVDLGMKRDIVAQMRARRLRVTVVPHNTDVQTILRMKPDGLFVSNGPGDPEPLGDVVATVRGVLGKVPTFGICLGHQILGLALGAETFKLPFGHHGGNHPVRRLSDYRVEITSQNHGFAVDLWSLTGDQGPSKGAELATPQLLPAAVESQFGSVIPTHQNLNDGTLEGLRCMDVPAFGVQYHPEAAPGPRDANYLFDDFVELMGLD